MSLDVNVTLHVMLLHFAPLVQTKFLSLFGFQQETSHNTGLKCVASMCLSLAGIAYVVRVDVALIGMAHLCSESRALKRPGKLLIAFVFPFH